MNYDLESHLEPRNIYYVTGRYKVDGAANYYNADSTFAAEECREMAREVQRRINLMVNSDLKMNLGQLQQKLQEILDLSQNAITIDGERYRYRDIESITENVMGISEVIREKLIEEALLPAVNYCNARQRQANSYAYQRAVGFTNGLPNPSNISISTESV